MVLRPTFTFRWAYPALFLALGVGAIWGAYDQVRTGGDVAVSWFLVVISVLFIGGAVIFRLAYIRVDESSIVLGAVPRRSFDRREVARIVTASGSAFSRRTMLLRSDGSIVWGIAGSVWGRAGLQSLANYLNVPFEGWG